MLIIYNTISLSLSLSPIFVEIFSAKIRAWYVSFLFLAEFHWKKWHLPLFEKVSSSNHIGNSPVDLRKRNVLIFRFKVSENSTYVYLWKISEETELSWYLFLSPLRWLCNSNVLLSRSLAAYDKVAKTKRNVTATLQFRHVWYLVDVCLEKQRWKMISCSCLWYLKWEARWV